MKYYILTIGLLFSALLGNAQQRVHVANFSQFQQYFNPALTGNEGTILKSFYRDQFDDFAEAPKTLFVASELNLSDIIGKKSNNEIISHAIGLSLLNDRYGALTNNRYTLSYNAGYRLNKKMRLHAGAALSYTNNKFDNDDLVFDENDPAAMNKNINKLGVNVGAALRSDNFYLGYALADIVEETLSDQVYFEDMYVIHHTAQAGYRKSLAQFGVILNGIFRYDERQKETLEGQLKGVYKNTVWLGAGYRNDLAYTINAGLQFKKLRVGYSHEINSNNVNGAFNGGNEITLSYNFKPVISGSKLTIW